jgi:hypothetical protein
MTLASVPFSNTYPNMTLSDTMNFLYLSMRTSKEVFNFGSGFIDRHEGMKLLGSSNCNYIYMLFIQVPLLSYTPDFLKIEFMFGMHSSQNWS